MHAQSATLFSIEVYGLFVTASSSLVSHVRSRLVRRTKPVTFSVEAFCSFHHFIIVLLSIFVDVEKTPAHQLLTQVTWKYNVIGKYIELIFQGSMLTSDPIHRIEKRKIYIHA